MEPVIIIQNDDDTPTETEAETAPVDVSFMVGELTARVESLEARLATLETHTDVVEATAETALDVAHDARESADEAEETAILATAVAVAETESDDETPEEYMAPVIEPNPVEDTPAEKPHWLFRSAQDWKE